MLRTHDVVESKTTGTFERRGVTPERRAAHQSNRRRDRWEGYEVAMYGATAIDLEGTRQSRLAGGVR
jgi:hypothetical protein